MWRDVDNTIERNLWSHSESVNTEKMRDRESVTFKWTIVGIFRVREFVEFEKWLIGGSIDDFRSQLGVIWVQRLFVASSSVESSYSQAERSFVTKSPNVQSMTFFMTSTKTEISPWSALFSISISNPHQSTLEDLRTERRIVAIRVVSDRGGKLQRSSCGWKQAG
jgi:hypothetical protein